jgi:hypothetical protein
MSGVSISDYQHFTNLQTRLPSTFGSREVNTTSTGSNRHNFHFTVATPKKLEAATNTVTSQRIAPRIFTTFTSHTSTHIS